MWVRQERGQLLVAPRKAITLASPIAPWESGFKAIKSFREKMKKYSFGPAGLCDCDPF